MNTERLMMTFLDLVKIDSPSHHEAGVAAYCEGALSALGFEVCYDDSASETGSDTGNLIARLEGDSRETLVLSSHMDCVEPCRGVEPHIEGGIITSMGDTVLGSDDKAGIAAILEAVRTVVAGGRPRPTLIVVFTTCEEMSCVGAKCLDVARLGLAESGGERETGSAPSDPVACVVFDADGAPGSIILGSPYHYTFCARITGRAAHAGVEPETGVSAIEVAARAIDTVTWGRLDECTTANVGLIEGGREVNIVAPECVVRGECRSLYGDRAEEVRECISATFATAADEAGAKVAMEWRLDYPGILYETTDPLISRLAQAAEDVGLPVSYCISGGGADANVFAAKGLKPVTLGIGMTNFHSVDEHIAVEDLENAARFAEAIIERWRD